MKIEFSSLVITVKSGTSRHFIAYFIDDDKSAFGNHGSIKKFLKISLWKRFYSGVVPKPKGLKRLDTIFLQTRALAEAEPVHFIGFKRYCALEIHDVDFNNVVQDL